MFRVAGAYFVVGWLLMQMAAVLEGSLNLPSWFDTFVTVIVLLGFPIALFFAWAFELTPDGVKPTKSIADEDSIAAQTGRQLEVFIIIGLAMVSGLMIYGQFFAPPTNTPAITKKIAEPALDGTVPLTNRPSLARGKSVAVLPFVNRSADKGDAYFADGIHDDLLTQLSKISALQVISRTSVMGFADSDKKIPEIANELGVSGVMEGAVQRGGNNVQISVQLIDGETDIQLWGDSYLRELTPENIFEIQSEITHAIAKALETVLTGEDEATFQEPLTRNMAAYDNFIQAEILNQQGTTSKEELDAAIAAYDKALTEDPDFAQAWAGKARAQISKYWLVTRDPADSEASRISLDRAQELAPNSPETLITSAYYQYWGLQDFETSTQIFDQAIKAAPNNANARAGKAFILRRLGQFEDAAEALQATHRLDPLSYYLINELAITNAFIGRFDDANAMMQRAKEVNPNSQYGPVFEAAILQFQGEPEKAWNAVWSAEEGIAARFYEQLASYAVVTRDPEKIALVRESWPEDKRSSDVAPEAYNIFNLISLIVTSDTDGAETAKKAMRARIENRGDRYPEKWGTQLSYSPVVIPGLLGDLEAVEKSTLEYEQLDTQDAYSSISDLTDIAEAFARAGDPERAFDYIDKVRDLMGPQIFLVYQYAVGFDSLRDHPRYLKMKSDYETWAKNHPWKKPS